MVIKLNRKYQQHVNIQRALARNRRRSMMDRRERGNRNEAERLRQQFE